MDRLELLECMLDSLKDPFVFADTSHTVRYLNAAAGPYFPSGRTKVGASILDLHREELRPRILEVYRCLENGDDERKTFEDGTLRIFMRAVRDREGSLVGYYERYDHLEEQ